MSKDKVESDEPSSTFLSKTSKENVEQQEKDPFFLYRCTKQTCLVATWVSMALTLEVVGPCIPDMKAKTGLNYEELSRAMIGTSVGLISASAVGGVIHERFYGKTDLFMALGSFIGVLGMVILVLVDNMGMLAVGFFCCGLYISLSNPGGNAMVMHLWGDKSGPPMYSLHFGFGLGGLLAPQIAKPFLSTPPIENETPNYTELHVNISGIPQTTTETEFMNGNNSTSQSNEHEYGDGTNIFVYSFVIVAVVDCIIALCHFLIYIIGPPKGFPRRKGATTFKTLCSPKSCAPEGNVYSLLILSLLFFFYMHVVGGEHIYGKWIFTYAVETDFTKDQAANLLSVFWFCHMTGRGSGMIFSKFIPTKIVLVCDICLATITAILLCIFGHRIHLMLWILTGFMGLTVSPVFPAGMLWSNMYLDVNAMSVMTCMLGLSAGYLIYVYLGGFILEYFGARYMMVVQVVYGVCLLVTLGLMELVVKRLSFKHNPQKRDANNTVEMDLFVNEKVKDKQISTSNT